MKHLTPKTELGRKLLELREKALTCGMELLTADEINEKVKKEREGKEPIIFPCKTSF